jgi:hypothetical protein
MSNANVTITADQLKDILGAAISTAIAEARKPVVTEKEQREIEEQQRARAAQAAEIEKQRQQRIAFQKVCKHRRRDNSPRVVDVRVNMVTGDFGPVNYHFLLCQRCQLEIFADKPEQAELYQSLMQDLHPTLD